MDQLIVILFTIVIFIIITITIFSKKYELSYSHVIGYAILLVALLLVFKIIKEIKVKDFGITVNELKTEVSDIQINIKKMDFRTRETVKVDLPLKEAKSDIIKVYQELEEGIKKGDQSRITSNFSKKYSHKGMDRYDVINGWSKYFGKSIVFSLKEIIEDGDMVRIRGSALIVDENYSWDFEDFLSYEDGQWQFIK